MKQSLLLVMTLIVVAGCRESPTSAKAVLGDYFPLHDGDRWIYRIGEDSAHVTERDTVTVSGIVSLDSITYSRFIINAAGRTDTIYYRKDATGKVYIRPIQFSYESLFRDFSKTIGEYSYPLDSAESDLVASIGDTVTVPAGTFTGTFSLYAGGVQGGGSASGAHVIYARDIGLIEENKNHVLETATIGAISYP